MTLTGSIARFRNVVWYNFKMAYSVLRNKPVFLMRVVWNYAHAILPNGIKRLRFVDVSITHICNFNCIHCSEKNLWSSGEKKSLTIDEYRSIAKKLRKAGAIIFHFTGGEPFMSSRLEKIITAFEPAHCFISIQTNGSLVTPERLAGLAKIGVDMICVSIDGSSREEHDAFRKYEGSFEKCLNALRMIKNAGIQASISTVVTKSNLRSRGLLDLIHMARDIGSVVFFNLAVPLGNYKEFEQESLAPEDRVYMLKLMEQYPHCRTDFESNYYKSGCGALKEKCYVTPEGDVIPCPFIHIKCGNVLTEDIDEIRAAGLEKIPELKSYPQHCPAAEDIVFHRKYYPCESMADPAAKHCNGL